MDEQISGEVSNTAKMHHFFKYWQKSIVVCVKEFLHAFLYIMEGIEYIKYVSLWSSLCMLSYYELFVFIILTR